MLCYYSCTENFVHIFCFFGLLFHLLIIYKYWTNEQNEQILTWSENSAKLKVDNVVEEGWKSLRETL